MENVLPILLGTILINNLAMTKLVGISQLAHFGDEEGEVLFVGISAALVMLISSILAYAAGSLFELGALNLLVYMILVLLATGVVTLIMKSVKPEMYERLKKVLPLLSVNSAVFYLLLENAAEGLEFLPMLVTSIGAPIGLLFAFVLYGAVRERLAVSHTPKAFKGLPILLVYAALAVLALSGLNGIL
jgi:electron transport complex protein RnfA